MDKDAPNMITYVLSGIKKMKNAYPQQALGIPEDVLKACFPDVKDQDYIKSYSKKLLGEICGLCGGYGHFPNDCATKRNLDKAMRESGLSEQWGLVKADFKANTFRTAREAKRKLREGD